MSYWKIVVYCYVEPQRIDQVDTNAVWYREDKLFFEPTPFYVVALQNGYRVRYRLNVLWFRKVKKDESRVYKLIDYIRTHKSKYPGWVHHLNVFDKDTKQFVKQYKIDIK